MTKIVCGIAFHELKCKGEIERYDKLNELHPKYPIIIYNHAKIQTKAKEDYIDHSSEITKRYQQ